MTPKIIWNREDEEDSSTSQKHDSILPQYKYETTRLSEKKSGDKMRERCEELASKRDCHQETHGIRSIIIAYSHSNRKIMVQTIKTTMSKESWNEFVFILIFYTFDIRIYSSE